jgi:hypothetical protein
MTDPALDRVQHEQHLQADDIKRLTARIEKLELIARAKATIVEFEILKEKQ